MNQRRNIAIGAIDAAFAVEVTTDCCPDLSGSAFLNVFDLDLAEPKQWQRKLLLIVKECLRLVDGILPGCTANARIPNGFPRLSSSVEKREFAVFD